MDAQMLKEAMVEYLLEGGTICNALNELADINRNLMPEDAKRRIEECAARVYEIENWENVGDFIRGT